MSRRMVPSNRSGAACGTCDHAGNSGMNMRGSLAGHDGDAVAVWGNQ